MAKRGKASQARSGQRWYMNKIGLLKKQSNFSAETLLGIYKKNREAGEIRHAEHLNFIYEEQMREAIERESNYMDSVRDGGVEDDDILEDMLTAYRIQIKNLYPSENLLVDIPEKTNTDVTIHPTETLSPPVNTLEDGVEIVDDLEQDDQDRARDDK